MILSSWLVDETIDYKICEKLLLENLNPQEVDYIMEITNTQYCVDNGISRTIEMRLTSFDTSEFKTDLAYKLGIEL